MKRLLFAVLILTSPSLSATAGEKANTLLIHPGEVVYARFVENGKKLKLITSSKEKDDSAQLVLKLEKNTKDPVKDPGFTLTVINHFTKDLSYKVEMRSLSLKAHLPFTVYPVVEEKMSFEKLPPQVEELALYGFELIL